MRLVPATVPIRLGASLGTVPAAALAGLLCAAASAAQSASPPAAPAAQENDTAPAATSLSHRVDALVEDLVDEWRFRPAAEQLIQLGEPAALALATHLSEPGEHGYFIDVLRDAAILRVLSRMGRDAAPAAPALAERLFSGIAPPNQSALLAAVSAAAPYAHESIVELREGLDLFRRYFAWDSREYFRAVTRVWFDPDQTCDGLVRGLDDPNAFVRELSAELLGERGDEALTALPALLRALQTAHHQKILLRGTDWSAAVVGNFDPAIHGEAARAMVRIAPDAPETISAWIHRLGDPDAAVREAAAMALGRYGAAASPAVPALRTALGDLHLRVAREAVTSLGMIGATARPAVAELRELTGDPDRQIAARARAALQQIQRER